MSGPPGARTGEGSDPLWWQRGVVYQIYPRSFLDSDGDGVGDLEGIRARLPYLEWLGVDAIWLSPIYPSPMADFGYDVSDHTAIHPLFGSMADFERLLEDTHARGMRLILDIVPNHTSDRHPWFLDSRSSRESPRRDWYIWRDPAPDGGPPNNWRSVFGGSAWEWDEETGQYYYHAFLKEQPDLNWRNAGAAEAMLDVMRFWLDRGVDGFRVDVMWHMIKDEALRDNPPNPSYDPARDPEYDQVIPAYSADQPEVHEVVARMRAVMDRYEERVMIGEIYLPIPQLVAYYGRERPGAHLPFNFQLVVLPWRAETIFAAISEYEGALPPGGWPNWVLGNHDRSRIATRVGREQARVAAMLLLTLRGTPTLYYGDEIGMRDVAIPPELVQDPQERNEPGKGLGRDPERTPMQWDPGPNAGFTTGTPWLPIADDYGAVNVESERAEPDSVLSLHRRLLELRREEPALSVGSWEPVACRGDVLAYLRRGGGRTFLIALNLGPRRCTFALEAPADAGTIVAATTLEREGEAVRGEVDLGGDDGLVILIGEPAERDGG